MVPAPLCQSDCPLYECDRDTSPHDNFASRTGREPHERGYVDGRWPDPWGQCGGDKEARAKDVLGRVCGYFLAQFAGVAGKKSGGFYTHRCLVKLQVEMLDPYRGQVYDPRCGSSGMFVQSVEFIRARANGNGNGGVGAG